MASAARETVRDGGAPHDTKSTIRGIASREGATIAVQVSYRRRDASFEVLVHDREGQVLCAASADDPVGALHGSAAVLGLCDDVGYQIVSIDPFPWAQAALDGCESDTRSSR